MLFIFNSKHRILESSRVATITQTTTSHHTVYELREMQGNGLLKDCQKDTFHLGVPPTANSMKNCFFNSYSYHYVTSLDNEKIVLLQRDGRI